MLAGQSAPEQSSIDVASRHTQMRGRPKEYPFLLAAGSLSLMVESLVVGRGLSKKFGEFTAVDNIDFNIEAGEAFGFLGPNGAGKSSTMRMIGAVSPPTSGRLRVLGMDPLTNGIRIRGRLGVVPQEDNLDRELSVYENLLTYGRYFNMSRAEIDRRSTELLEFVQLSERRNDQVDPLSGGMKRRLIIARGLINQPELLILDEPTTGLDPQARHVVWERLYQLKREGVTLIVTTHYMDEAEQLCDRLVVMDKGRIVAQGSPRELIERYSTKDVLEMRFEADARRRAMPIIKDVAERTESLPDQVMIYTHNAEGDRRPADPTGSTAPSPPSSAAPPWKMSSCGSPDANLSNDHSPGAAGGGSRISLLPAHLAGDIADHLAASHPLPPGHGSGVWGL